MSNEKFLKALEVVCKKLGKKEVVWVLGGSLALAFRGVELPSPCRDVDIFTTEEGALRINKLRKDYEVTTVTKKLSGIYSSFFGVFLIEGIRVEVIGNLQIEKGNILYRLYFDDVLLSKIRVMKVGKFTIKLLPLEEQLVVKMVKGEMAKLTCIAEYLKTHTLDLKYLHSVIERGKFPKSFLRELYSLLG